MIFLNSYSARFKSFGDSVISLMVFGYLKPNDLKPIMEKGEAVSFLRIYHIGYLVVAIFAIVNFIVAVISDADSKVCSTASDIQNMFEKKIISKNSRLENVSVQPISYSTC